MVCLLIRFDDRADYQPIPSGVPIPTSGPGISATPTTVNNNPTATQTGPRLVLQTVRDPAFTAPPTLFGLTA